MHPQTEIIAAGVGAGVSVYYGETFVIPDSVRIVCGKLFNSGGVDNIEIGKNAYFYDENPFSGMVRIKKFSVDPENPYYTTDDKGVLYSKDFKTLICYPGHSDYTSYTINEQCEEIAMGAFAATDFNHLMLQKITIPESVVKIGDDAFEGIFFKNKGLTDVYYQGSLSGWLEIEFGDYYSNPMVYADNLYINGELLQGDIIIPEGTGKIGDYAFYNCSGLTSITIPDSVTSIGDYTFSNCDGLTSITIPDSVTSIGSYAFWNCSGLTSITIPDSVTSIGDRAFYNCSGLTSITIPFVGSGGSDNTHFGYIFGAPNHAYNDRYVPSLLKEVIITGGTSIGSTAFYYCSDLTNIIIPDSVTSIEWGAFLGCSGLTSITIPDSVTSIGEVAFSHCNGLTSINYQGTMAQWNTISKGSNWAYNTGDFTITCTDGVLDKNGNQV